MKTFFMIYGVVFCLYQELKLGKLFIHNSDTRQFQVWWSVAQKYIKTRHQENPNLKLKHISKTTLVFSP